MARKKVQKSTRTAKSDAIKGDTEPEVQEAPPPRAPSEVFAAEPVEYGDEEPESEVSVTADPSAVSLFENPPPMPVEDELRPDQNLLEAQKAEFKKLLDAKMTLQERADQLVKLAKFTDTKRAPVGLRAIQVINEITGVNDDLDHDAPSMFKLPDGVKVKIKVETAEK